MSAPDFLVHHPEDSVGVVVVETVEPGRSLTGWVFETDQWLSVQALPIPLGHKPALRDIAVQGATTCFGETSIISRLWWSRSLSRRRPTSRSRGPSAAGPTCPDAAR